jgi:LysW-gamma-L-lysine carboxypeptidase
MNVVAPHWPVPTAAYGPGDSALDHTPEERLSLDEYDRAVAVLTDALTRLAHTLPPAH